MHACSKLHITRILLISGLCFASINAYAEPWSPALKLALSQNNRAPFYSYQLNFKSNNRTAAFAIDPTLSAGKRIIVTAPDIGKRDKDFNELTKQLEEDVTDGIWCSQFARHIPASVKLIAKTADTESYQFTPVPDAGSDSMEKKVIASLLGEVTISTDNPAVQRFSMRSTQAIKPIFFVTLSKFQLNVSCERSPDGRTYAKKQISTTRGTAMGKSIDDDEEITIADLVAKGP
jgi:hypothetical protein